MRRRRAAAALVVALCVSLAAGAACAAPCAPVETSAARIERIADHAEPVTTEGARLRLFGLRVPGDAEPEAAATLTDWLVGREVSAAYLTAGPDRWGRRLARLATRNGAGRAESIEARLIAAGLARVEVEPGPAACLAELFALEDGARRQRLGLWADAAALPVPAADRTTLAARDGDWIIVEGRVTSIGEAGARLFLNYGPIRTIDFSASVLKSALRKLRDGGLDPAALRGVQTRVRGMLDTRFGPRIEIVYPGAIEVMK